ncbi:uncharacterized protein LOC123536984 [Mercenaria mercenaria]|uniref:uncharacterized protein LOC123536984 n=1 Tax=Mercenaria mercenaria TaxID=6596 RepID=UPI00234F91FE|nr:uncharacterized protein LOC123536984 [Mercenaria mercenaria]
MNVHGLKALKLVFLCSVIVSFVQVSLYRTIVLNAKHSQETRYPWKLETRDTENEAFPQEHGRVAVNTSGILQEKTPTTRVDVHFEGDARVCNLHVGISEYHRFVEITSNLSDWSYNKRLTCPMLNIKNRINTTRMKLVVRCHKDVVSANLKPTNSTDDIQKVQPGDNCLRMFVQKCCSDSLRVPNVVHYVWFNKKELSFFEFVSFMSTLRFVRPCAIFIHGNMLPSGNYWNFIVNMYPNIVHVVRMVKATLFGNKVHYVEHNGDIWRIKALQRFGGIYMDTDTLLVKPIEPLRKYPCTLSRQTKNRTVSSAFIMSERNATFIREWYELYIIYYVNDSYTYNAMMYPSYLANGKPEIIHIEYGTISRPDEQLRDVIFNTNTGWSNIYGMHLFVRSYINYSEFVDENNVKNFNTTVGAICRHILFGNKQLCT